MPFRFSFRRVFFFCGAVRRRAPDGACLLRPSHYQLLTPPSRLRRLAVIAVRLQRTARPPPPPPRRCWPLHAYATPRAPTRARALLTPPCGSTLLALAWNLPPARPNSRDQGFHPPVCAAPGLPGRGASSSLLLSNIFFQLLFGGGALADDSARRRVVPDVSLSRRLASTQCFRRRRATSACARLAVRSLLIFLAQFAAPSWPRHARRPS